MTVFSCKKCGAALTPDLTPLTAVPMPAACDEVANDEATRFARSTIPQGFYAVDPDPWGAPFIHPPAGQPLHRSPRTLLMVDADRLTSAGPRNTVILHPSDAIALQQFVNGRNREGCCGPTGAHGPNLACSCGSRLATLAADCLGPCELHLDPLRVYPIEYPASNSIE
jgi:hypothetical protein